MAFLSARVYVCCVTSCVSVLLSGCSLSKSAVTATTPSALSVTGGVHGGQQPISGSSIQLYAVGVSGNGSTATPLLNPSLTTDSNGNFDLTGHYTCPSSSRLTYLTATGGNPGLPGTINHQGITMMALLGPCGSLSSMSFIQLNELTTVAAAFSLGSYATSFNHVGYSGDASGITASFNAGRSAVSTVNGRSTSSVNTNQVNTIANILAACVNSQGTSSTACSQLSGYTGNTGDIFNAALHIAANPADHTADLFSLTVSNSPFSPMLAQAPATFGLNASDEPAVEYPDAVPNTPTFESPAGVYPNGLRLYLGGTTSNANAVPNLYYTLDGSTPTKDSTPYTGPIEVGQSLTVKVIAIYGSHTSSVASASYQVILLGDYAGPTVLAGNGQEYSAALSGNATDVSVYKPTGIARTLDGTLFFTTSTRSGSNGTGRPSMLYQLTAEGQLTVVSVQAIAGKTAEYDGVAIDSNGNLYLNDWGAEAIRQRTPSGAWSSVYTGLPNSIAVGPDDMLYVAYAGKIDKVNSSGTVLQTRAIPSSYGAVQSMAISASGDIYFVHGAPDNPGFGTRLSKLDTNGTMTDYAKPDKQSVLAYFSAVSLSKDGYPITGLVLTSPLTGNTTNSCYLVEHITTATYRPIGGVNGGCELGDPTFVEGQMPFLGWASVVDSNGNLYLAARRNYIVKLAYTPR